MKNWLVTSVFVLFSLFFGNEALGFELDEVDGCYLGSDGDMTESGWSVSQKCVFATLDESLNPMPRISVDGHLVVLKEKANVDLSSGVWEVFALYESEEPKVRVEIQSKLGYDSCAEVTESCCGQHYEGKMVVTVGERTKVYMVGQWHGM